MPKHQQRSQRTPYSRPQARPERPGIFARLKSFFWGAPKPVELGPPRVVAEPRASQAEPQASFDEDQSRITHDSIDLSQGVLGRTHWAASPSHSEALSNESRRERDAVPATASGPNETLRRFFEQKQGEELSDMEVVGVLSLISQAVGQNESLVDFSNLSDITANATASTMRDSTLGHTVLGHSALGHQAHPEESLATDRSVLWGLHAPPSPRPYLRGTPPSTQTRARASYQQPRHSPWVSPRPSRSSLRRSVAGADLGVPTQRLPKPSAARRQGSAAASTSDAYRTLPEPRYAEPASTSGGRAPADPGTAQVTPAASAILRALDDGSTRRVLSTRGAQPATSTPSKRPDGGLSVEQSSPIEGRPSAGSPALDSPAAADFDSAGTQRLASSQPGHNASHATGRNTSHSASLPASSANKDFSQEPLHSTAGRQGSTLLPAYSHASNDKLAPAQTRNNADPSAPHPAGPGAKISADVAGFEFSIPVSKTSRQLTPAEEEIVARSQSEFTF